MINIFAYTNNYVEYIFSTILSIQIAWFVMKIMIAIHKSIENSIKNEYIEKYWFELDQTYDRYEDNLKIWRKIEKCTQKKYRKRLERKELL